MATRRFIRRQGGSSATPFQPIHHPSTLSTSRSRPYCSAVIATKSFRIQRGAANQLTACHNLHRADARSASSYRVRRTTVAEAGNFQSKVQMRPEETPKSDGWGIPGRQEICRPQVLFLCKEPPTPTCGLSQASGRQALLLFLCKGPPTCSLSQVPTATCRTGPCHACRDHAGNVIVTMLGTPSPLFPAAA